MHYTMLLSLLGLPIVSKASTHPALSSLQARECYLPANFTVTNFTIYTDFVDPSKNLTSFWYSDERTGIDTFCSQNSTSKPDTINTNSWPCDDSVVAFIYDATEPIPELCMIERACPASGSNIEATGYAQPNVTCTNTTSESKCISKQSSITGQFVSLEPVPPTS
ncbi:hypothetical protein Hte_000815 [Hypoxylon texense]